MGRGPARDLDAALVLHAVCKAQRVRYSHGGQLPFQRISPIGRGLYELDRIYDNDAQEVAISWSRLIVSLFALHISFAASEGRRKNALALDWSRARRHRYAHHNKRHSSAAAYVTAHSRPGKRCLIHFVHRLHPRSANPSPHLVFQSLLVRV